MPGLQQMPMNARVTANARTAMCARVTACARNGDDCQGCKKYGTVMCVRDAVNERNGDKCQCCGKCQVSNVCQGCSNYGASDICQGCSECKERRRMSGVWQLGGQRYVPGLQRMRGMVTHAIIKSLIKKNNLLKCKYEI